MSFSSRLKKTREFRRLSQKAIADRIFVSQQAYAKYETGASSPNPETLKKIADVLNVSPVFLLTSEEEWIESVKDDYKKLRRKGSKENLILFYNANGVPANKEEEYLKIITLLSYSEENKDEYDAALGIKIPVLGTVPAGIPLEAIEEVLDYEEITEDMARNGKYIALQIKGDSMLPTICNGDVVIVRLQPDVESGETVIVMVNGGDATCKKVVKHTSGITLVPNNPAYDPRFFTNEEISSIPVRILGKVVELRRKF